MNNDFIKNMRTFLGMTQKNLADASGVNIRQIQRIEKGETDANKLALKNAVALMDALGVEDVHLLLFNKNQDQMEDYINRKNYTRQQLALFYLGCASVDTGYFRTCFEQNEVEQFHQKALTLRQIEKAAMSIAAKAHQRMKGLGPYSTFYAIFDQEADAWSLEGSENAHYFREGMLVCFAIFSYTQLFGGKFERKGETPMNENVAYAEKESICGGGYPDLNIGDRVALGEVWSGEGENPMDDLYEDETSYSYFIKDNEWINYVFKPTGKKVDSDAYSEDAWDEVEITNIEIL
ncbi:helix-turn-helix transcriptional regulator [Eubacterium sp. 1001713B170207_170306_E7]|uniref:helix-turn-helix domain-containing protein n=1 Tax=Eubacterium sp. 1001713B170207_170306_E7 TaxID=2787097 RepID=UPI00189A755E|nr:helix-turn-helix transcriptional regulator [Eubacterium sp. 1001713B170207_170306_E7]